MILEFMWSTLHSETQDSITVQIRNLASETRTQKHNMLAAPPYLTHVDRAYFFQVY